MNIPIFQHISQTKQVIVRNLFWSVVGKIVNLLSGLLVGIIVARYLGPEKYGLMNYVISYVFLFQTFALFGLDSIEIREEARGFVPHQQIIGTAFVIKLLFALFFILLVIVTSLYMEADLSTTLLTAIYSATIAANSFSVARNYFTAIVQNEFIVKAEIVSTLVSICIKLLLLFEQATLTWFLIAYTLDAILISTAYIIVYRIKIGPIQEWTCNYKYAIFLIKESFPLMLTNAAVMIYQRIDQVMIGQIIDKESVGFFSVASRFVEVLIYIPMILAQTITPVLVSIREKCQKEYILKSQQFMNISLWLSLFAAAMTSALSYWIVIITFGTAYLPAVAILQVMSFKTATVALSNTAGAMLVIEGLQRFAILRDGLGCIVCVLLNYLLLPRYGILAAAFVAILSNLAAGYLADAIIPAYRHLFIKQTRAILLGWQELLNLKSLILHKWF